MTKPVLLVFYLIWGEIAGMTNMSPYMHQERRLISTRVGGTVTLKCVLHHVLITRFHWYKQLPGREPRLVCTYKYQGDNFFHDDFKKSPRFTVDTGNTTFHLTITDLRASDSATYYCASSFTATIQFADGVVVNVDGSGVEAQALVRQSAPDDIRSGGDSVALRCPLHRGPDDGRRVVHWFISSENAHLGVIYSCENNSGGCERNRRAQTHTCVYKLPMKSVNTSHYCAVASCGHVEFGNGLDKDQVDFVVSVRVLSGAVALCNILSALLGFCMCRIKRKRSCVCAESAARFPHPFSNYAEHNLRHDANAREKELDGGRRRQNDTWSQCVYFSVEQ